MLEKITAFRKELHQNPELSGQEESTSTRIRNFIEKYHNTKIVEGIGGHGIAAIYDFLNTGPVIMIRCELDGLPINESSGLNYMSMEKGISHSCGHDGHMAIVAGLIFWIKEQSFENGKIILLFQPAEETGKGAIDVLKDPKFRKLKPDYIFALHNIPGEPLHTILTRRNSFTATVQSLIIFLTGKESHASEPEMGINPASEIAEIIQELESLNLKDPNSKNFALITPIHINLGRKTYGISAGKGELHFTLRTWEPDNMDQLKQRIIQEITHICKPRNIEFKTEWFDYFPSVINSSHCYKMIELAAKSNDFDLIEKQTPFKFGEDFAWFSQKYKAAMFGIGAGIDSPALHHPDYDFPDELIETGLSMLKSIISKALKQEV